MDSKVKIAGHPLHPMLVAFPVALYTAALAAFVVHAVGGSQFWWRVGLWSNLVGVGMALLAALPGLVDLLAAIPRGHPAKKVGLAHMSLAVTALALFATNLVVQRGAWVNMPADLRATLGVPHFVSPDVTASLLLSGAGFAVTLCAGFLGWTLVQKHHVGIADAHGALPAPLPTHPTPPRALSPR